MPAVINFAANLALGSLVVLVLPNSPALRRDLMSWPLLTLVVFESLLFTPVATYLFRFYPQWSMLYLFDPQIFPTLENWIGFLSLIVVLMNFMGAIGGFYATREGLLRGKRSLTYAAVALALVISLTCVICFGKRLVLIGDYDAFWQGNADIILIRFAGWLGLLLYASTALFVLFLRSRFADHDPKLI
jgi:hypothetical protein